MPESVVSFHALPPEYQHLIRVAEERYGVAISPLQELAGGWSGAVIYLVRVASTDSGKVEHLILKLDRKRPKASSDEVFRHQAVQENSPAEFAHRHIPDMAYDKVEAEGALAIFYTIAGQSLHNFRTLSRYRRQSRLETLFAATNHYLLEEWNAGMRFEPFDHPVHLLEGWLSFRLGPGQKIEGFIRETCGLPSEIPGFLVEGKVLPNPLYYAREQKAWGAVRPLDAAVGMQHGDLNTNNILAKFTREGDALEGYYLIDFALFKEDMPLTYDQRYLEMSYLVHAIGRSSFASVVDLLRRYSEHDLLGDEETPIEMAGVNAAVRAGRQAFDTWVREEHPSLHDDLWGQYWLAGAAAGLAYAHKAGLGDEIRLAGLIYAAANLKQFCTLFGIPMPVEAAQLYVHGPRRETSSASPVGRTPHNLPAPATHFIGREKEIAELTALLMGEDARLVTLTGPGGTGKTRLGLEVGRALLEHFPHGVFFVDLAQVRDPSLAPSTIAHAIGIREGGNRPPLESLKDTLALRKMLLILDNFEQVVRAAPQVAELLAAAPGIKALVTSRVPLHLRAEHEYPVAPLQAPLDAKQPLEQILEYEAVALFRQQARAARPSFDVTEENREAVVGICRRLDGLPLAIEIAAARVKMLPPKALQKRLDQSLNVLVGGAQDLPQRQQTLRQTIDWSFQLLTPDEQDLFIRLGIFSGGFTLEAAEAVCNPTGDADVFAGVEALLDNSLLRQVRSVTDEPRFDMLQTIREYALEKATEAGITDEMHGNHFQYFARLASGGENEGVYGPESVLWMHRFEEEHDNYRAAFAWVLQNPVESFLHMITMMSQITWFWYRCGYLQEGSEWTERYLHVTEAMPGSMMRAVALTVRSSLALWSGDLLVAERRSREAIALSQQLGMDDVVSVSKLMYGTTLINQGRDGEAYPHMVDAAELFDEHNQVSLKGAAMVHLANISLGLNNPDQALWWLDSAMPFLQTSGDIWGMAFGLNNYGEVARAQGDYEKAEEFYRRTEELFKQSDAKGDQARLVHTFGYIALHKGEYERARDLFLEALEDFRELGNPRGIAECLAGLAGVAFVQGQHRWAAPLLSAAESHLRAIGGAWWPADRVEIDRAKERMREALGEEFGDLWQQGEAMPVEQAIAYATDPISSSHRQW